MEHYRELCCVGSATGIQKCTLHTQGGAIGKVSTKPVKQVKGRRFYSKIGDLMGVCICRFKQSKSTISALSCFFKIKTYMCTHICESDFELI